MKNCLGSRINQITRMNADWAVQVGRGEQVI